ncbi:hypothetical protein D3C85_1673480 [compost metagenome]
MELPQGKYRVVLLISGEGSDLGYTDIQGTDPGNAVVTLAKKTLTPGKEVKIETLLDIQERFIRNLEVRTWYQSGNLSIQTLTIERLAN